MIGHEQTTLIDTLPLVSIHCKGRAHTEIPATLFLHGWGGNANSFQPLWEVLQAQQVPYFKLIAVDLPGFGKTPPPSEIWDIEHYASCVLKFLDAHDIPLVDLVSHSFGGRIATKLLVQWPHRFRKVVYIAPAGIHHKNTRASITQWIARKLQPLLDMPGVRRLSPAIRTVASRFIGSRDYNNTSGVMREIFKRVIAEDTLPLFQHIQQEAKIFWGKNDTYVPASDGQLMINTLPHASLTVYPDGRHGIHLTHAKAIAKEINDFLYL